MNIMFVYRWCCQYFELILFPEINGVFCVAQHFLSHSSVVENVFCIMNRKTFHDHIPSKSIRMFICRLLASAIILVTKYLFTTLCRRFDEAENIPVSLNLENVKKKGDERLLQIRTNPPSPQCFSVTRSATKTTSSKSSTYRSMVCKLNASFYFTWEGQKFRNSKMHQRLNSQSQDF